MKNPSLSGCAYRPRKASDIIINGPYQIGIYFPSGITDLLLNGQESSVYNSTSVQYSRYKIYLTFIYIGCLG